MRPQDEILTENAPEYVGPVENTCLDGMWVCTHKGKVVGVA